MLTQTCYICSLAMAVAQRSVEEVRGNRVKCSRRGDWLQEKDSRAILKLSIPFINRSMEVECLGARF